MSELSFDGGTRDRATKYLEGYIQHHDDNAKIWKKYWTVLRGSTIFLFTTNKTSSKTMVGTLFLGSNTELREETSKKVFKFELLTILSSGISTSNLFKFSKKTECDLWKAFIYGLTKGIVPDDVQLLPGQRKQVEEAAREAEIARLASLSRPSVNADRRLIDGGREKCEEEEEEDRDGTIDENTLKTLQQLNRRQIELSRKLIDDSEGLAALQPIPDSSAAPLRRPSDLGFLELPQSSFATSSSSSSSSSPSKIVDNLRQLKHSESATGLVNRGGVATSSRLSSQRSSLSSSTNSTSPIEQRRSFLYISHPFYSDESRNKETPRWFVNCSRTQAEDILKTGSRFGTILMRAGSSFPVSGNYVISFRRERDGKVQVCHYSIVRTNEGFKIDVENEHRPMSNLSSVMDFFSSVAGSFGHLLTTNNLTELLGKYQATAFPVAIEDDHEMTSQKRNSSSRHSRFLPSPVIEEQSPPSTFSQFSTSSSSFSAFVFPSPNGRSAASPLPPPSSRFPFTIPSPSPPPSTSDWKTIQPDNKSIFSSRSDGSGSSSSWKQPPTTRSSFPEGYYSQDTLLQKILTTSQQPLPPQNSNVPSKPLPIPPSTSTGSHQSTTTQLHQPPINHNNVESAYREAIPFRPSKPLPLPPSPSTGSLQSTTTQLHPPPINHNNMESAYREAIPFRPPQMPVQSSVDHPIYVIGSDGAGSRTNNADIYVEKSTGSLFSGGRRWSADTSESATYNLKTTAAAAGGGGRKLPPPTPPKGPGPLSAPLLKGPPSPPFKPDKKKIQSEYSGSQLYSTGRPAVYTGASAGSQYSASGTPTVGSQYSTGGGSYNEAPPVVGFVSANIHEMAKLLVGEIHRTKSAAAAADVSS